MEKIKLLIFGLPGSGKTSLAKRLSHELNCVWFNGDETRSGLYPDLGFSESDRLQQARRMGLLCDITLRTQKIVIADFICPTNKARGVFSPTHTIFMNTIQHGRFPDTNAIFENPENPTIQVDNFSETSQVVEKVKGLFLELV